MNEVVTTILPHPITMFILGGMLLGVVILYREYTHLTKRMVEVKNDMEKLIQKMESHVSHTDEKMMFISKKVDSRVDKALLGKNKS